jgi:thiamine-phosphate pyrophosphorylase
MLPRQTLFTDERIGDDELLAMIDRLPQGSGVLLRHYGCPAAKRAALGQQIARCCRERGLILSVAADVALARQLGAAMVHKPEGDPAGLPVSLPVHDEAQALAAKEQGAALVYVSPVHPTLSHPGAPHLGPAAAARLAQLFGGPAIALGGMTEERFEALDQDIFSGWAAITAWR